MYCLEINPSHINLLPLQEWELHHESFTPPGYSLVIWIIRSNFSSNSVHASDAISASGDAISASGQAAGVSAMLVVSMPLISVGAFVKGASMTATQLSQEHSSSHKHYQANSKPKLPPPMQVKSIEIQQGGGYQVKLQDPVTPDNQAELRWPARQDNPTTGFKVGELVHSNLIRKA